MNIADAISNLQSRVEALASFLRQSDSYVDQQKEMIFNLELEALELATISASRKDAYRLARIREEISTM